jgi:hypothetical protein
MNSGLGSDDILGLSILSGVALIPCLVCIYYGLRALRMKSWPVTPGRVTQSDMIVRDTSYRGVKGHSYEPVVAYNYSVAGRVYTSKQVKSINLMFGDPGGSESRLAQYPVGKEIDVYYNPAKPADAVLEQGTVVIWLCWIGLDLGFIGMVWLVALHRANH